MPVQSAGCVDAPKGTGRTAASYVSMRAVPLAPPQPTVAVVGAGIVGLTTAMALTAAGHAVVVVAADASADTVSAVAGGLWSPFRAGPADAVQRWARVGYGVYAHLSEAERDAGVRMIEARLVVDDDTAPHWWESCAPAGAGRASTVAERPAGVGGARVVRVPSVDTALHLAWLRDRLAAAGTRFVERRLDALDDAFAYAPVVVACPGLAARELCQDGQLKAVRGVVVEVALAGTHEMRALLDDRGPQPTYVLPRPDDTALLGGRADAGDERLAATADEVADVIARCTALVGELAGASVLRTKVGLRPGRPHVRVGELPRRRGRMLVNYGHGGSGWTIAAGCAQDIVELVARGGPVATAAGGDSAAARERSRQSSQTET